MLAKGTCKGENEIDKCTWLPAPSQSLQQEKCECFVRLVGVAVTEHFPQLGTWELVGKHAEGGSPSGFLILAIRALSYNVVGRKPEASAWHLVRPAAWGWGCCEACRIYPQPSSLLTHWFSVRTKSPHKWISLHVTWPQTSDLMLPVTDEPIQLILPGTDLATECLGASSSSLSHFPALPSLAAVGRKKSRLCTESMDLNA